MDNAHFTAMRRDMIKLISVHAALVGDHAGKHVLDSRVMEVMGVVARHEFVPHEYRAMAYDDHPLPIGYDKTVSQPFMVALMTDLLEIEPHHRVLEIGTGLGYQAAVLSRLAKTVYSIEIIEELHVEAQRRLKGQGYSNIELRLGNGYQGWPEQAPFDAIIATAAPDLIPPPLLQQLKPGGKMVIPAGFENTQQLMAVAKDAQGRLKTREVLAVRFSSMIAGDDATF
ncbi:MAG: protein-L-isoaspartate(D-aspartate) O-methyltransferase [Proteobacteria bacterium]|nr:protein-L-isoaspartate(D-aspartate) O-methyltransferase [Pseudomonadota bacterium]